MKRLSRMLALILVITLLQGCSGASPTSSGTTATGEATSQPTTTRANQTPTGKPTAGPYYLSNPATGLDGLAGYRATLKLAFSGTQGGKPSQWSQSYDLSVAKSPQARLLAYQETGLDPASPAYPALEGVLDGVVYTRNFPQDNCAAAFVSDGYDSATLPEPASLLPKVRQVSAAGSPETINGQNAIPFTFDAAAVTQAAGAQAAGKLWLAEDGSTLIKFSLSLKAGSEFFGPDSSGTMTWEYLLNPAGSASVSLLPAGCPQAFAAVPAMADAKNALWFPGFQGYETASSIEAVANFYLEKMPEAGFTLEGDARMGTLNASLTFSRKDVLLDILVESGNPARVSITRQQPAQAVSGPVGTATPNAVATTVAGSPQMRVVNALTLLNGSEQKPSVFASYHLDYSHKSPSWKGDKLAFSESQMSADVEGTNIHFTRRSPGSTTTESEVYLIGDKEYEMKNGKLEEGLGLAALAWVSWPLDVVMPISIGSANTTPAGSDTLDGWTAEVYKINGKASDDPTGMLASLGFGTNAARGTVWVDAATGGLLKAVIDYDQDVKDSAGAVKGQGSGHLELSITRVGKVSVKLP